MRVLNIDEFERYARRLPAQVRDFVDGGGGDERTLAANLAAYDRVTLRPRVLVDVATVDTSISLFGAPLAGPLGVAPTAYHQLVRREGEVGTALGAGAAGALYVVSIFASQSLEEIAAVAAGPLWLQLYWFRRREVLTDLVVRAEAAGYRAIVLTVDAPRIGRRFRDQRNGFAIPPKIRAVNLDPELMSASHQRRSGVSAVATHAAEQFDQTVTWADLAWLRGQTTLPLVLKGILTGEDAVRAVEAGADGIIVSNHGGRQLDGVPATLDVLPEVVAAVAGRCPVLLDGGIRRGTDAFAALALGAAAVLVGRPALWALAVDGARGVEHLLTLLRDELEHTMALAGRPTIADIDATAVRGGPTWSS